MESADDWGEYEGIRIWLMEKPYWLRVLIVIPTLILVGGALGALIGVLSVYVFAAIGGVILFYSWLRWVL